jgi:predicted phosphate transport protein (TIGR00153 family)
MANKNYFSRMFGSSPDKSLQKHMQKVHECAEYLVPLFESMKANDAEAVRKAQQTIVLLEDEADTLKVAMRMHLPQGLLLPVNRSDLLDVLRQQDAIANKAKDIAGLVEGRGMRFPENMAGDVVEFATRCVDAVEQARKIVNELDELIETGFKGIEVSKVEKMLVELDEIESDTDSIQVVIRAKLFEIEKDLPPIDVMFMYKLIEWIGDIADHAETVGSRLQLMLAK